MVAQDPFSLIFDIVGKILKKAYELPFKILYALPVSVRIVLVIVFLIIGAYFLYRVFFGDKLDAFHHEH